jgi:hypothetical protein
MGREKYERRTDLKVRHYKSRKEADGRKPIHRGGQIAEAKA